MVTYNNLKLDPAGNTIKIDSFQDNYKDFRTIFGGGTTLREPLKKFNKFTNGTGTVVYNTSEERYVLSVATAGDYAILQQSYNNPYFEGNRQIFDITSELMHPETGKIKMFGYWDMQSVGVDFAKKDGILIETDDTKVYLRTYHDGTKGFEEDITAYTDWEKFAVLSYIFLWLGGALLEPYMFLSSVGVKELIKNTQVGLAGQFIKRPNKPITMAILSTSGAGSCKYICSMVATKQVDSWAGLSVPVYMKSQVNTNIVGTYYHLKSVKIAEEYTRGGCAIIERIGMTGTTTSDAGILLICKGANISPTMVPVPDSIIEESNNLTGTTITEANLGTIISAFEFNSGSPIEHKTEYIGKFLPISISGDNPIYNFIYLSLSATQSTSVLVNFIEFK